MNTKELIEYLKLFKPTFEISASMTVNQLVLLAQSVTRKSMTKFNPKGKKSLTFGETLGPAMKITERADADQYLKDYVAFIQRSLDREPNPDGKTAEQLAKANLGYYAGYYDHETHLRVEKLFFCEHPTFGKAENGEPTPLEAFRAGEALVKRANKQHTRAARRHRAVREDRKRKGTK